MPSHIFTRVDAWADSATTNRRSADTTQRSNDPADALHVLDDMTYAYLQLARDGDARQIFEEARALTRINPARATAYCALAAMPARYVAERGAWRDAAKLAPSPSNFPFTEAITHSARALGAARSGDPAEPLTSPGASSSTHQARRRCRRAGHRDVTTTILYTHVLNRGPAGVRSPADRMCLEPRR